MNFLRAMILNSLRLNHNLIILKHLAISKVLLLLMMMVRIYKVCLYIWFLFKDWKLILHDLFLNIICSRSWVSRSMRMFRWKICICFILRSDCVWIMIRVKDCLLLSKSCLLQMMKLTNVRTIDHTLIVLYFSHSYLGPW
jgi:hypothetical protein